MPPPPLPLDQSRETKIFRALVRLLQSDPVLSNLQITWQVMDGETEMAPFTQVQCPAIRLIPDLASIKLHEIENYYEGVVVAIDFSVAGTNADDRLNLWAAIRDALESTKAITIGDLSDGTNSTAATVADYFRQNDATVHFFNSPAQLYPTPQPGVVLTNQYSRAQFFIGAFVPG